VGMIHAQENVKHVRHKASEPNWIHYHLQHQNQQFTITSVSGFNPNTQIEPTQQIGTSIDTIFLCDIVIHFKEHFNG
jgi:spore coat protein CotF